MSLSQKHKARALSRNNGTAENSFRSCAIGDIITADWELSLTRHQSEPFLRNCSPTALIVSVRNRSSSRATAAAAAFILAVEITDSSNDITLAAVATGLSGGGVIRFGENEVPPLALVGVNAGLVDKDAREMRP